MKKISLFPFLLLAAMSSFMLQANAQIITTLTNGSGLASYSGDGGAEFSATVNRPGGIFVDRTGNIYIADVQNYRIRKIDSFGIITTVAGNGGTGYSGDGGLATAAQLCPFAVFVDGSGNIFTGDFIHNVIRKIDNAGIITTIAGTGTAGYTGDGGPSTAAEINGASGVVTDTAGNVYFSDNSYRLRKINTAGIISTFCGTGVSGFSGDGSPATSAMISLPGYMHIDNATYTLYFEDNTNKRIRKINLATGIINTAAGNGTSGTAGDGSSATAAELYAPGGMTTDNAGNLYISDAIKIRVVNSAGIISTYAGNGIPGFTGDGGIATSAELNNALDVAIDAGGHLLISDNENNRIRIINNPCSGLPSGGSVKASHAGICSLPFVDTLSVDSITVTPGVTYYWQSSTDSVNWTNVPGALGVSCTPTVTASPMYFRFADSCTVSGEAGYAAIKLELSNTSSGNISGASGLCIGADITLTDTIPGGSWSAYTTGATISDSGIVHGVSAGLDVISYTITNACGTFTTTYPVTVYTTAQCDSILSVSAPLNCADNIKIYPNPTSTGSFTIETPENKQVCIVITDVVGTIIQSENFGPNSQSQKIINIKNRPPGTYFVKSICADKTYFDKITIIQ